MSAATWARLKNGRAHPIGAKLGNDAVVRDVEFIDRKQHVGLGEGHLDRVFVDEHPWLALLDSEDDMCPRRFCTCQRHAIVRAGAR